MRGRQPYADQGSAPYHWWPSRLADAFHRGRELRRAGEREEPAEQFLHHAAAITGLYVALVRLAPALGWELLPFSREVEAREEFTLGDRQAAIVPDAFVVIRDGEAEYHAMVEIDRGHDVDPAPVPEALAVPGVGGLGGVVRAPPLRAGAAGGDDHAPAAEQVVAKAEERARAESRLAKTHPGAMAIAGMVIAVTDCVDRPEAAVVDPVWRKRGGSGGLRLADLLREPWERWRTETAERAAAAEEAKRELEEFLSSERLRDTLQDLNRNWTGLTNHDEHLWPLAENDATALRLLLNATDPMTPLERRAWGIFARRTEISRYLGRPIEVPDEVSMSSEEREAIRLLREDWFARQKEFVASLHARYPYLPCSERSGSSTPARCFTTRRGATATTGPRATSWSRSGSPDGASTTANGGSSRCPIAIAVGRAYKHQPVKLLVADREVRILAEDGNLLRALTLDPSPPLPAAAHSTSPRCLETGVHDDL